MIKNMLARIMMGVTLLLIGAVPCTSSGQEVHRHSADIGAWTVEHNVRHDAIKKVQPLYPQEALIRGAEGVIEILIGIDSHGIVTKVKAPAEADAQLVKAVAEAARRWEFGPHQLLAPGKYLIGRLTFRFFIENGEGRAELYAPEWNSLGGRRMRVMNPEKDWEKWVDVPKHGSAAGAMSPNNGMHPTP